MGTRLCSCVRVRSRAGADDALTRMCASAARSLRSAIDGTRTGVVYRYTMHPCARARVSVRAPTHPCRYMRAPSRRRWTACGSARRRSTMRRRSTRTSARGTPRLSSRCIRYAPPFRPGRRATAGGTRSLGRRCGAGRCARRHRRSARVRVCAQTCGNAHARMPTCVGIAARTKDGIYVQIYMYIYIIHTYMYIQTCVRDGYGRACGCTTCNAHA
jgi:hypothetical protein